MTKHKHSPQNPFLAQMLFKPIVTNEHCQSVNHKLKMPTAEWELRFYQDPDLGVRLYHQGVDTDKISQIAWDQACKEQDTIGIVNHKTMLICTECALRIVKNHGGESAAFMTMSTATATGGTLLLVSERETERAAIVGNLPDNVEEKDILEMLRRESMIDLRFKAE